MKNIPNWSQWPAAPPFMHSSPSKHVRAFYHPGDPQSSPVMPSPFLLNKSAWNFADISFSASLKLNSLFPHCPAWTLFLFLLQPLCHLVTFHLFVCPSQMAMYWLPPSLKLPPLINHQALLALLLPLLELFFGFCFLPPPPAPFPLSGS